MSGIVSTELRIAFPDNDPATSVRGFSYWSVPKTIAALNKQDVCRPFCTPFFAGASPISPTFNWVIVSTGFTNFYCSIPPPQQGPSARVPAPSFQCDPRAPAPDSNPKRGRGRPRKVVQTGQPPPLPAPPNPDWSATFPVATAHAVFRPCPIACGRERHFLRYGITCRHRFLVLCL